MQNNDKKVLLRISNLKQYFPLKGGRFVKANDVCWEPAPPCSPDT